MLIARTKKELACALAEATALTQVQTKELLQLVLDHMRDTIIGVGRLELRNFGVFEVKHCKARMARNPRTGMPVPVPAKKTIKFTPGRAFKARVNRVALEKSKRRAGVMPTSSDKALGLGKPVGVNGRHQQSNPSEE